MTVTVAHSFPVWLPQTQTWLYHQVRCLPSDITAHIICKEVQNEEQFYLPNIHSQSGHASTMTRVTTKVFRHVDFHLYTYRMCRKLGPNILHSHFGPVGWKNQKVLNLLSSRKMRQLKHVVTFYGQDVDHLPKVNPAWRSRYYDMFCHVDLVLCEGPFMAEKVISLGCPENRVTVHHLGVDLEAIRFQPRSISENDTIHILMAAAFRPKKGFVYGLKALDRLADQYDFRVTLVGDETGDAVSKEEKRKILEFVSQSRLSDRVSMKGFITARELNRIAPDHHIYLAPSVTADDGDSEGGAPVSLIEMAASGMPVVSSRHCDIPEVIQHRDNGLLAGERDVEELSKHLEYLFNHPEKWEAYGSFSRRHIEKNFNARIQGQRLAETYRNVMRYDGFPERTDNDQKTIRLLFISHSGGLYGAERSLIELIEGLRQRSNYEIMVFLPEEGSLSEHLVQNAIPFRIIPYSRWIGSRYTLMAGSLRSINNRIQKKTILNEGRAWNPDLIYTNTLSTPVGAILASSLSGRQSRHIPHIWHARELPGFPEYRFGMFDSGTRKALNFIIQTTEHLICNSHFLAGRLKELLFQSGDVPGSSEQPSEAKPELHTVYNGCGNHVFNEIARVNIARAAQRKSGQMKDVPWQIIMAGGINETKNHMEAVDAVWALHQQGFSVRLTIYGTGDRTVISRLLRKIRSYDLQEYIFLAGHKNDVAEIYSGADILLVTSRIETFGRSALEAMLSGCAVVSSDAGAMPELVKDGETGLIYSSGDSEHLARQIRKLMDDPDRCQAMTDASLKYARETFSVDSYIVSIDRIIKKAVEA